MKIVTSISHSMLAVYSIMHSFRSPALLGESLSEGLDVLTRIKLSFEIEEY